VCDLKNEFLFPEKNLSEQGRERTTSNPKDQRIIFRALQDNSRRIMQKEIIMMKPVHMLVVCNQSLWRGGHVGGTNQ